MSSRAEREREESGLLHGPCGYFDKRQKSPTPVFREGQHVCYTRQFLCCIGTLPTDPLWGYTGKIVELRALGGAKTFALVEWYDREGAVVDPEPIIVSFASLAFADRPNLRACE